MHEEQIDGISCPGNFKPASNQHAILDVAPVVIRHQLSIQGAAANVAAGEVRREHAEVQIDQIARDAIDRHLIAWHPRARGMDARLVIARRESSPIPDRGGFKIAAEELQCVFVRPACCSCAGLGPIGWIGELRDVPATQQRRATDTKCRQGAPRRVTRDGQLAKGRTRLYSCGKSVLRGGGRWRLHGRRNGSPPRGCATGYDAEHHAGNHQPQRTSRKQGKHGLAIAAPA